MFGSVSKRVVAPTALTAATSSGLAVSINYATDRDCYPWIWGVVAALTLVGFVASLWLHCRQGSVSTSEPARGIVLANVEAANLDAGIVRSRGTGVTVTDSRFSGDLIVRDITSGLDDANNP